MPTFPASPILPAPSVDYGFSNQNSTVQSSFESGRVVQRARSTRQRDFAKVKFTFTEIQLAIFESFVANTLNNGAIEFEINLPNPASDVLEPRTALIDKGLYDAQAVAGKAIWIVTCNLILQDKQPLDSGTLYLLLMFEGDPDDMIAFVDFFHEVVHSPY